jgi:two-component system, sensor histidine kinase and response regulator
VATVVVAEDHEVNRMVVGRLLERLGHDVVTVADGRSALEALDAQPVDLLLLDCEMPVLDGLATVAELRRREAAAGDGRRLPVLALSAHAGEDGRRRSLEAGMDEHLVKPVGIEQLGAALDRWLGAGDEDAPDPELVARAIDETRFGELLSDFGEETAKEVVDTFLDSTPELVADARAAALAGDAERAAALGHKLKGGCMAIGARLLQDVAARLETEGRGAGEAPVLRAAAVDLDEAWAATRAAFAERLG